MEGRDDTELQCTPGDRYPLELNAALRSRVGATQGIELPDRVLAVCPYHHTFRSPVKGRWVGLPLLAVFVKEFAYVPDLPSTNLITALESPQASLDPRVTIPAYINELISGALRIHGRETECRAAGRAYAEELRRALDSLSHPSSPGTGACADVDDGGGCRATGAGEVQKGSNLDVTEGATSIDLMLLLNALPPRLLLRQRDIILHDVQRHETPMPFGEPLLVLRYDHVTHDESPCRLMVLHKPHGVPVHPSGRCRKNTVTSILEDIFGGADSHRYHAVPHEGGDDQLRPGPGVHSVSVRHRLYGFELVRVWIGEGYVSHPAWEALHAMMQQKGSPDGEATRLKVYVVHRLDSATSGVLIFGLDSVSARITAEVLSQKGEINNYDAPLPVRVPMNPADGAKTVGCTKRYLARVHGRFDAVKIAAQQHHCSLISYVDHLNGGADTQKSVPWLCIDRPIGCYSYHNSLYWCPDEGQIDTWLSRSGRSETTECRTRDDPGNWSSSGHLPNTGRKRSKYNDINELEAKHVQMKKLTMGTRGSQRIGSETGSNKEIIEDPRFLTEGQLQATLKSAATLVRSREYDQLVDQSIVECILLTGRTHQVRVHLASIGYPIVQDQKYIDHLRNFRMVDGEQQATTSKDYSSCNKAVRTEERTDFFAKTKGIKLHAWRYTLSVPSSTKEEQLEAPLPQWATLKTQNQKH